MAEQKLKIYDSCVRHDVRTSDRRHCVAGSRYAKNYHMVVTEQKHLDKYQEEKCFVEGMKALNPDIPNVGEWLILEDKATDLYEQIQSYREGCDLKLILKKYQNGDESALNAVQGVYGDFTDAPTNLADAFAMAQNYVAAFNGLPLEIRKEYGHNPSLWMHAVTSGEFQKKFMKSDKTDLKSAPAPAPISVSTPEQVSDSSKGEVANE